MSAPKHNQAEMAETFKALGHPDRVRLVEELREEEKDVQTLSDSLGVRQARVSQHLAVLRASHIVEDRREGRHVLYRLAKPALAAWIMLGGLALMAAPGPSAEELNATEEVRLVLAEEEDKQERNRKKR